MHFKEALMSCFTQTSVRSKNGLQNLFSITVLKHFKLYKLCISNFQSIMTEMRFFVLILHK